MNLGDAMQSLTVSQSVITDYYEKEEYAHAEFKVKDTSVFTDDVLRYFNTEIHSGKTLGFIKTEDSFRVRPSELTVLTGVSGHGKSLWLSQVILSLMSQGTKCLLSSLEMRPVLSIARMIQQTLGSPEPTDEYIEKFCERAKDKLYIYDQTGSTSSEDMIATLYWGKHVLGVDVFVIDSLMKMSDISEDNYEKQICVWRNRNKEREVENNEKTEDELKKIPDAMVFVQKQRNYQFEGKFSFWFDPKGLKYKESPR